MENQKNNKNQYTDSSKLGGFLWKNLDKNSDEKNKKEWSKTGAYLRMVATFFKDHWRLLIKSAAQNHLRIQECKKIKSGDSCNLNFSSYSELKRYQKKVRLFTYSFSSTAFSVLAVALVIQMFFGAGKSQGANYTFTQDDWLVTNNSASTANHASNQNNFKDYFAKDTGFIAPADVTSGAGADIKLLLQNGNKVQTSDTDFNYAGNTNTTTSVAGSGSAGAVQLMKNAVQISAGLTHTCAIKSDGTVWCWGYNGYGQLGDNTLVNRSTATQVKDPLDGTGWLTNVKQVSAGDSHTCAIKNDGTAWCWGLNGNGQLGDGTLVNKSTPVKISTLTNAISISNGRNKTCAVKGDGTAWCWGSGADGRLGLGSTTDYSTPQQVSTLTGLSGVKMISSGASNTTHDSTCAVKSSDGSVWCWGYAYGISPVNQTWMTGMSTVSIGSTFPYCSISNAGAVICSGNNSVGNIGDGTLVDRTGFAVQAIGMTNIKDMSSGVSYVCAVKNDGTVWCWGNNVNGQFGNNTTTNSSTPLQVPGFTGAISISTQGSTTCALKGDGSVWCWGQNLNNTVGDNTTTQRLVPTQTLKSATVGDFFNVGQQYGNGTFVSSQIDLGQKTFPNTLNLSWSQALNGGTIGMLVSTSIDGSTWTNFEGTDGSDQTDCSLGKCYTANVGQALNTVHNGARYLKYKVFITSADQISTPSLNDVTISYQYYSAGTLTSSWYDTTSDANHVQFISWDESLVPAGTQVKMQIQTAPNNAGVPGSPTGFGAIDSGGTFNTSTFFTYISSNNTYGCTKSANTVTCAIDSGTTISDNNNDRWMQYKLTLVSDGSDTPQVDKVRMGYIVNAPPDFSAVTAVQQSDGKVSVNYKVRDTDTSSGVTHEKVTTSLQYWDGSTWHNAVSASGDVGSMTVAKTNNADGSAIYSDPTTTPYYPASGNYNIVWDAKNDFTGQYFNNNFKVRVVGNDGEQANNLGYGISSDFRLDTKNPTNVSFTIDHSIVNNSNNITLATPSDDSTYQIEYSNLANFSDASFENFPVNNKKTYTSLTSDPATVYIRVKDAEGNYTDSSSTTPAQPQHIVYYDTSNAPSNDFREFIAWDVVSINQSGAGFGSYKVYRADRLESDQNATLTYAPVGSPITDRNINFFSDANLDSTRHYYYKVIATDSAGNVSQFSSAVDDNPNGQGGSDHTPPTISNVQVSGINTTSATVTWTTDELSDSSVGYSEGSTYLPERGLASMTLNHQIILTGLTPGTAYNIRVKSRDLVGNLGQNDKDSNGATPIPNFTFSTLPGPAISNVSIPAVSNNQATINWNTTTNSSSFVVYSTAVSNGLLVSPKEFGSPELVSNLSAGNYAHSQTITTYNDIPLASGTKYYFEVKSVDGSGNVAIDNNGANFYSLTTTTDTMPPTITADGNNPIILTDTRAALHFVTSENSISRLGYKKTSDSSFTYTNWETNYNVDHIFTLENLVKETPYAYQLEAKDINSNSATSTQLNFQTLQSQSNHPDLTDPGLPTADNLMALSDNQALISIKTNTDATAVLCWATSSIANFSTCISSGNAIADDTVSETHIFQLGIGNQQLNPNTKYYYRIKVADSLNLNLNFTTANASFTTKKIQVDQHDSLSNVTTPTADDITVSSNYAFINWHADQPSNTDVTCGTKKGGPYDAILSTDLVDFNKDHTTKLIGLQSDSEYFCQITASDDIVPTTTKQSNEFSFITGKDVQFQHDPLSKIENLDVPTANLADTNAVVTFITDQIASCKIDLTSLKDGKSTVVTKSESGYDEEKNYNVSHAITLSNLDVITDYTFIVSCHDNIVKDDTKTSIDEKYNFITKTGAFKTLEKLFTAEGAGALGDHVPPVINNVSVSAINGESVTVTWDTDEKASSGVGFGIASTDENGAVDELVNKDLNNYTTTHTVILTGLIPATKYIFVASSNDASGNIGQSSQSSFITASPSSISSINAESKNLGEALITWNTSSDTTSVVEYGLTTSYGEKKESNTLTANHSLDLSSLNQGVTYHFRVKGTDKDGKLYASSDQTFQPKSPPQISNISINGITEHEATVSFETNVPTDATVAYANVSNASDNGSQSIPEMSTKHTIQLKNLSQGTTFSVKIRAKDEQGTESSQDAKDLTTGKDENPPKIDMVKTDLALAQNDKVQAIISWVTDEQATTSIIYKEGKNAEPKEAEISSGLTTNHIAVLTVFKPGTVYFFNVKSVDASGNSSISSDYALLTPKKTQNIIQIIIGNFTDIFGWAKF